LNTATPETSRRGDILFIGFEEKKEDYPSISYSFAALVSTLRDSGVVVSVHTIDTQYATLPTDSRQSVMNDIRGRLKKLIPYCHSFGAIAIPLASWTIDYCESFLSELNDYTGLVIAGGYEVTANEEGDLTSRFPRVDYFIKGYAEHELKRLIVDNERPSEKFLDGKIESADLVSPYLTKVFDLTTRKIYWETKRGCQYRCGFCEWGNAATGVTDIDAERLDKEIDMFRQSGIDEVNILDATFNNGKKYLSLMRKLLDIPGLRITCQARYEALVTHKEKEFLDLCSEYSDRVHLEFGLQTIHEQECKTIGRINNIAKVDSALTELGKRGISFETSLIYAIPGQTVSSLIDNIEYLVTRGCRKIRAFPLRIAANSEKLVAIRNTGQITEEPDIFGVDTIFSSSTFTRSERKDMDRISERLDRGQIGSTVEDTDGRKIAEAGLELKRMSEYQREVCEVSSGAGLDWILPEFKEWWKRSAESADRNFLIYENRFLPGLHWKALPNKIGDQLMWLVNNLISGRITYEIGGKRSRCVVRLSNSGNRYVYGRSVESYSEPVIDPSFYSR